MKSQTRWKPGPALAKETSDMLQFFANEFPRTNLANSWRHSQERRDELINTWAWELRTVILDAIVFAAHRWMADNRHIQTNSRTVIPSAASFGVYAREMEKRHFRASDPAGPKPTRSAGRAHELMLRAHKVLQSWPATYLVIPELLKLAPDPEAEQRVRDARIGSLPEDPWPRLEHFDQAVEIVRAKLERRAARDAMARKVG